MVAYWDVGEIDRDGSREFRCHCKSKEEYGSGDILPLERCVCLSVDIWAKCEV